MHGPSQLPTLQTGINTITSGTGTATLPALVLNQLMMFGGNAIWIDANNMAQTGPIARLSPSKTVLERITVARAFTPYQHVSLTEDLPARADRKTSLFVLPCIDYLYNEETLADQEQETLFETAIAIIERECERYDVPALITTTGSSLTGSIPVEQSIRCTQTSEGVRISTERFETLVYQGQGYIQTTLRFWEQLLAETYERTRKEPVEASIRGTN